MDYLISKYAFPIKQFMNYRIKELPNEFFLQWKKNQLISCCVYEGEDIQEDATTILYFHGNSTTLETIHELLIQMQQYFKCRIVTYDYPGYGFSTGKPLEKTVRYTSSILYNYVKDKYHKNNDNIILWGYSIGSVPAIHLAHQYPNKLLIIQSGCASAFDVVYTKEHCSGLNVMKNYKRIRNVKNKNILIVHGLKDQVIPARNGMKLFQNAIQYDENGKKETVTTKYDSYTKIEHNTYPIRLLLINKMTHYADQIYEFSEVRNAINEAINSITQHLCDQTTQQMQIVM